MLLLMMAVLLRESATTNTRGETLCAEQVQSIRKKWCVQKTKCDKPMTIQTVRVKMMKKRKMGRKSKKKKEFVYQRVPGK